MDDSNRIRLIRKALERPPILKLDRQVRELTGYGLTVLFPSNNLALPLQPSREEPFMPEFCELIRSTPEGLRSCNACHSLIVFGACSLGVSEHICIGGVLVLAACIHDAAGNTSGSAVVSSCEFTRGDRDAGWEAVRSHAQNMGIDVRRLKVAYYALPLLSDESIRQVKSAIDVSASIIGELARQMETDPGPVWQGHSGQSPPLSRLQEELRSALLLSRDKSFRGLNKPAGLPLVEVVEAVIERNPGMRLSVSEIAKAAHMTPNHFSMLFHRHAGRTFKSFLNDKRMKAAQRLLGDLTLSVAEVADQTGFDDPGYFTRRFKKATGKTPRQWRNAFQP